MKRLKAATHHASFWTCLSSVGIASRGDALILAGLALLQDAANATLRSEALRETMCDAIIANGGVREPSKMCKTFAMTDASNTVRILVACVMKAIRLIQ